MGLDIIPYLLDSEVTEIAVLRGDLESVDGHWLLLAWALGYF